MDNSRSHLATESEFPSGNLSMSAARDELERARAQVAAAVEHYRQSEPADMKAARNLSSGVLATVDVLRARDAALASGGLPGGDAQVSIDLDLALEARQILQNHFDDLVPDLLGVVLEQRPIPGDVDRILRAMLYLDAISGRSEASC